MKLLKILLVVLVAAFVTTPADACLCKHKGRAGIFAKWRSKRQARRYQVYSPIQKPVQKTVPAPPAP